MEIERKFLVKNIPDLTNTIYTEITQGYLSFNPEIRIRQDGNKYYITKKSNGDISREEIEIEIEEKVYNILFNLIEENIINKTRYFVYANGKIAELNIYHGDLEGLSIVEVEFKSLEEASNFEAPLWFGKEVTYIDKYKNKNIAKGSINIKELKKCKKTTIV